jgi:uncharacterized membrane protein (DUF4010 family)
VAELTLWQSFGVALAIGLLVGAERERSKPDGARAGLRTCAVVALVGALATVVDPVVAAAMVAAVVLLVAAGYVTSTPRDPGLTSEVATVAVLGLGALSITRPALAAAIAVTMTVLLVSRDALHRFVRETVTERESTDALKFFVAAFVLLPVLPTTHVGPYGAWVPQRIWLLVVLITGIGWVGHVAIRLLGQSRGLMVAGLAGGFVSATATTGVMGARARRGEANRTAAVAGALLASLATLVQLGLLTALVEPRVTTRLLPAIIAGSAVLAAEAWWLDRRTSTSGAPAPAEAAAHPFALAPALVLAGIISLVLPLALWLDDRYGSAGAVAAAGAGALADVHGASVAVASLAHDGQVSVATAETAVGVGLATNTFGKLVAAVGGGGFRFALAFAAWLLPPVVLVAAALVLL